MTIARTIAKNTLWLFIAEIISKLSFLGVSIYIARFLGVEQYGLYAFALSFGYIFVILSDLGLNTVIIREVAQKKELTSNYYLNGFYLKFGLAVISIFFLNLIILLIDYPYQTRIVLSTMGTALIIQTFSYIPRDIFHGHQRMKLDAIVNIVEKITTVGISLYALYLGYNLYAVALAFLISGIISTSLSIILFEREFPHVKERFNLQICKFLFKESLPLALVTIFGIFYLRIDTILISFLLGNSAVGYYSAAAQLVEGLVIIPMLFINAVFPVYSEFSFEREKMLKALQKSLKYLSIIAFPLAFGTIMLSKRFIELIYGIEYYPSVLVLQVLMINLIFLFLLRPLASVLIAQNEKRAIIYINITVSVLNMVFCFVLIKLFGFYGAAIATLISSIVFFNLSRFYAKFKMRDLIELITKPFFASILMCAFVYLIRQSNLAIIIGSSTIVYFLLLLIFKTFKKDDILLFREVFYKII